MPPTRLGFIGAGSMGQAAHLRNYASMSGCEIVALAELRPELGSEVARRYGVAHTYVEAEEMLAREDLDALVVIQPFTIHGRLLPSLLARGLPMIIEKPLARSVELGERILADRKAKLFVGYHKRSDPAVMAARELISEWNSHGRFGKMKYVRITIPPGDWVAGGFSVLMRSAEAYPSLERDPLPQGLSPEEAERSDTFVNFYIHQVNLARHLMCEPYEPVFVDSSEVLLIGRSTHGLTCAIEMAPYQTSKDWQESALVCFERGWIRIDLPAPLAIDRPGTVSVFEDGQDEPPRSWSPTLPWVHAMKRQAELFIKAVNGEPTPLCSGEEALDDLRIARGYLELSRSSIPASG